MGNRKSFRLTAVSVNAKKDPGYYADGNGLYLQISKSGSKSWILRFSLNRRTREMGLGSIATYSLSEARERAKSFRQLLDSGIDPIENRLAQRNIQRLSVINKRSFEQCAIEYHKLHMHGWKNTKHADQWINTLKTYAFPKFGSKDISSINKADILSVLEPIWSTKSETASRVRQRIRVVLDWAAARDYRHDHDPHIWDQISRSLPKINDLKKTKHFLACKYADIANTVLTIRGSNNSLQTRNALEFLILTASRSGEVRGAMWSEIDMENQRWTIPSARMKAGKEHRVPLSDYCIKLLQQVKENSPRSELLFPSSTNKPLSDMTLTMALRRLGFDFTVHGFRSTFRDWAAEQTAFPREVCEAALAHVNTNATEAAYFRSDLFVKRQQLLTEWAAFVNKLPAPEVVVRMADKFPPVGHPLRRGR